MAIGLLKLADKVANSRDKVANSRAVSEQKDGVAIRFPVGWRFPAGSSHEYILYVLDRTWRSAPGSRRRDLVTLPTKHSLSLIIGVLAVGGSGGITAAQPEAGGAATGQETTQGVWLLRQGRPREALALLQQAAERQPADPKIHYNLGVAHARLRDFDRAIEAFGRAVDLAPQHPDVHFALAVVLEVEHRQTEAAVYFEKAAVLAPGRADYHFRLGKARKTLGKVEGALTAFASAIELDSTHVEAHYLRADLLASSNRPEAAEGGYRQALALDGQRADVLLGLGTVCQQQGKHLQAANALVSAVELEPRNIAALYLLSQAYLHLGLPDEREQALTSFQRLSSAQWLYKQGDLYARRGALEAAREALGAALALDPGHAEAREKLSQVGAEP